MTQEKIFQPKIIPSLSGKEISRNYEVGCLIYSIKNLVSCPTKTYTELYRTTLWNIAEFCQTMPYSENEFNWKYGFLTRQLSLAFAALKLRQGVLFPKSAGAESIAAEDAQWTYAIFTGSLVKNLYQLQENREVNQYQLQGDFIGLWSPMVGSLYSKSFYYSMYFVPPEMNTKRDIFMAAVSQHIFPTVAINWLSTNTDLFKQWWDVVLHQAFPDNDIETIIQLAGDKAGISL